MDDILGLIGGLLSAGSGIYTSIENNQQGRTAETQRNQQYTQLNNLVNNPQQLLANIMAMKRSLTADEKNLIIQTVTASMANSGQSGAPGLVEAAVNQALIQADNQLFQEAANSYLSTLGLPLQALRGQPPAGISPMGGSAAGAFSGTAGLSALAKAIQKATTNPNNAPGLNYTGTGWYDPNSAFGGNYNPGMDAAESSVPVPSAMDAAQALVTMPIAA